MYAHPLVLNAVPVGSSATTSITRNVLLTATMGNTLAAWDADTAAQVLFEQRNFQGNSTIMRSVLNRRTTSCCLIWKG